MLKKPNENTQQNFRRLFWVFCAVIAVAASVMYLRVTVNAPLGGDDCINNPSGYYDFMQRNTWALIMEDLKAGLDTLLLRRGRFFGLPVIPYALICWARQDIYTYRMYIIGVTCLVIILLAWLMRRIMEDSGAATAYLALVPLMFCLWGDYQINGLYSYNAFPQSTLLVGALAGHCTVSWAKTRRWPWALAAACTTLWSCAAYELGYSYIFMIAFFALSLHDKFRDTVVTMMPAAVGEAVALAGYLATSALNRGNRYVGVQLAEVGADNRFWETWVQQMSGGFPLNQPLISGVKLEQYTWGDWFWAFVLALLVGIALYCVRIHFSRKKLICLFFAGLMVLVLPAALIGASTKYQHCGWVTWESSYIPAVVESFGVAMMLLALLLGAYQCLREKRYGQYLCLCLTAIVVVALTCCGAYQRAATRERYPADSNDSYNRLWRSIESVLVDRADEDDLILCTYDVWGGDSGAESVFFSRYAGRPLNVQFIGSWEQAVSRPDYYTGLYGNYGGYDTVWCGNVLDESARLLGDVIVYVDNTLIPPTGVVKYYVDNGGGETLVEIPLSELEHSETDVYNGYFITLPDENIVAPKIMIWG